MTTLVPLTLASLLGLIGPAPQETPSALERDPDGWTDLLAGAGRELKGWTRVPIPPDGALDPETQWALDPDSGVLVCAGDKGHEWLRWDEPVADGTYHVEWRFVPVADAEGPVRYNSGVYARNSADGRIWHQAQTGDASGGYLFGQTIVDGEPGRVSIRDEGAPSRVRPAGEWNTFELDFEGPRVTLWVNGAVTAEWDACEVPAGHVGLEAEGYRIEFRRVLLKPR